MSENSEVVARALRALGEAWRGDWADCDGRTIRHELDTLAVCLAPGAAPVTYGRLCIDLNVCPENRCWPEWCPEHDRGWCPHLEAAAVPS